jgi:hypothetical protein
MFLAYRTIWCTVLFIICLYMLVRRYQACFVLAPHWGRSRRAYLWRRGYSVRRGRQVDFPLCIFFLDLYNCIIKWCLPLLVAMHLFDGKSPFKDMTRVSPLSPWSTLFINVLGRWMLSCYTWVGYKWFMIQTFMLWNVGYVPRQDHMT